jgi:hypothetical protein
MATVQRRWTLLLALTLIVAAGSPTAGAGVPKKGDTLPAFEFEAPATEAAQGYLGISGRAFKLADIPCRVLLIEVIGIYCPQCYRQAPLFNTLHSRIEKGKLKGRVKMLALAAGGNANEIQYLSEQVQYAFPIVPDPKFELHKRLGEPRTPFTLLVDPTGKVLHTHMGVIEDIDAFLNLITSLAR